MMFCWKQQQFRRYFPPACWVGGLLRTVFNHNNKHPGSGRFPSVSWGAEVMAVRNAVPPLQSPEVSLEKLPNFLLDCKYPQFTAASPLCSVHMLSKVNTLGIQHLWRTVLSVRALAFSSPICSPLCSALAASSLSNGVEESHNSKQKGSRTVVHTPAHSGRALQSQTSLCLMRIGVGVDLTGCRRGARGGDGSRLERCKRRRRTWRTGGKLPKTRSCAVHKSSPATHANPSACLLL